MCILFGTIPFFYSTTANIPAASNSTLFLVSLTYTCVSRLLPSTERRNTQNDQTLLPGLSYAPHEGGPGLGRTRIPCTYT